MANTIVRNGGIINVSVLDADFEIEDIPEFARRGIWLQSILFTPGAASDVLVVRDGLTGNKICTLKSDAGQQLEEHFGEGMWCKAAIDVSECTFGGSVQEAKFKFDHAKSLCLQ